MSDLREKVRECMGQYPRMESVEALLALIESECEARVKWFRRASIRAVGYGPAGDNIAALPLKPKPTLPQSEGRGTRTVPTPPGFIDPEEKTGV